MKTPLDHWKNELFKHRTTTMKPSKILQEMQIYNALWTQEGLSGEIKKENWQYLLMKISDKKS